MGPTASGKTELSQALAERLGGEIITVDSAQVYRGMDIGTAKPTVAERGAIAHHLIDILDPGEAYSAARFCGDALRLVGEIHARGRVPILAGGTMLYFRALTDGLSDLPGANREIRARLEAQAAAQGWPALHARLAAIDPATAARLHPNDQQRIQRALEMHELTGTPPSALYASPVQKAAIPGRVLQIVLSPPERSTLHRRIEQRFRQMIEQGFVDEVAALRARGDLHLELPSMRAVGYRQIWRHLDGAYDLQEAVARAIAATRQFAKRQLTWLRGWRSARWLDSGGPDLTAEVTRLLHVND